MRPVPFQSSSRRATNLSQGLMVSQPAVSEILALKVGESSSSKNHTEYIYDQALHCQKGPLVVRENLPQQIIMGEGLLALAM